INRGGDEAELIAEELTEVEPADKFQIFEKVVQQLGERPGFTFEKKVCFQLPWPRGSNLAATKTITGMPVQSYVALLKYQSVPVIVIEVDTESLLNSHTLSNLIVVFSKDATEGVKSLLQRCSTMGLYWDLDYIKRLNAVPRTCAHPHRVTKSGGESVAVSPEQYQRRWVNILERHIKALVKEVKRA
ncbi:MAG: Tn7-like element transposition protein TnsE, partial [Marinobacter sp.]